MRTVAGKAIKETTPAEHWWMGISQEGYIARFNDALPNIDELGTVVDDTLNYLKRVYNAKSDFERKEKRRFR